MVQYLEDNKLTLLLNTEEAKTDEDSENIRIRVWEKISSELTDLTVFDKSEPKPGIPGGITFTKENGSWNYRIDGVVLWKADV